LGLIELLGNKSEKIALEKEFVHLKEKHGIRPFSNSIVKFSRMRPHNSPLLKLKQFALLLHSCSSIFLKPIQFSSYAEINKVLKINTLFIENNLPQFGQSFIESTIINVFAVCLGLEAKTKNDSALRSNALQLISDCKFEFNFKSKLFYSENFSAQHSQGAIHVYDNYCLKKQCLQCAIGKTILSASTKECFKN
jgi:hypothetical protein